LPISAPAAVPPTVLKVPPNTTLPTLPPATAPTPVPICALVGGVDQPVKAIKEAGAMESKSFVVKMKSFVKIEGSVCQKIWLA